MIDLQKCEGDENEIIITQDWNIYLRMDIYFLFKELQEMLFHYSDDIVKAPVHNTQTLLEEYVDTEKDVVKGSN